jgi:hypothetical protein
VAISGLRSFNLHKDQASVAAGLLDMIVFTVNPNFDTRDKVVCVSNKYIHEIILRPAHNCYETQIYVATRWLSKTYTNEQIFMDSDSTVKGPFLYYFMYCIFTLLCARTFSLGAMTEVSGFDSWQKHFFYYFL